MNVNSVPFYTWESHQGNLDFYNDSGKCRLYYKDVEIKEENIKGTSFPIHVRGVPLTILAENIQEFSNNYFFRLTKENGEQCIDFFAGLNFDEYKLKPSNKKRTTAAGFVTNKLEKKIEIPFSNKAPNYRIAVSGLNLEGECVNKVCLAYEKNIIIQKGFGSFSICKELVRSVCPLCTTKRVSSKLEFDV